MLELFQWSFALLRIKELGKIVSYSSAFHEKQKGAAQTMEPSGVDLVEYLLMLRFGISGSELYCFYFLSNFLPSWVTG